MSETSSGNCSTQENVALYSEAGIKFLAASSDNIDTIAVFVFLTIGLIAVAKGLFFSSSELERKGVIKSVWFLFLVILSVIYMLFLPDMNEYNEAIYSDLIENPSDFSGGVTSAAKSVESSFSNGEFDLTNLGR